MGVEKTDYVIVGVKVNKDKLYDYLGLKEISCSKGNTVFEYFEKLEDENKIKWSGNGKIGNFVFVDDDESDSFIVGIVVDQAESYDGEWLGMTDCLEEFEENKFKASEKLRSINLNIGKISIFTFSHAH